MGHTSFKSWPVQVILMGSSQFTNLSGQTPAQYLSKIA